MGGKVIKVCTEVRSRQEKRKEYHINSVNGGTVEEIIKGNDSLSSVLKVSAGLSGRQCTGKF